MEPQPPAEYIDQFVYSSGKLPSLDDYSDGESEPQELQDPYSNHSLSNDITGPHLEAPKVLQVSLLQTSRLVFFFFFFLFLLLFFFSLPSGWGWLCC
jgi:hypothetical protein